MRTERISRIATILGTTTAAAVLVTGSPFCAVALAQPVTLDAGTVIPLRLQDTVGSSTSRPGDPFTATIRDSTYGSFGLPAGTTVEGTVSTVHPMQGRNAGVLGLKFSRIRLPNERSVNITGSLIGLDDKSVTRTSDGRIVAKSDSKNKSLLYAGYGAGAGLLVATIFKGNSIQNALLGGGLGYLFSQLSKQHGDPKDVTLRPGTDLGLRLDRTVSLDTTSGGSYNNNSRYNGSNQYSGSNRNGYTRPNQYRRNGDNGTAFDPNSSTSDIAVLMDDQTVSFNNGLRPVMYGNAILVPAAQMMRSSSINYKTSSSGSSVVAYGDAGGVRATSGSRIAVINGSQRVRMEAPARMINGTLYVPLRFVSLATGDRVTWDSNTRTVVMTSRDYNPNNRNNGDTNNDPNTDPNN